MLKSQTVAKKTAKTLRICFFLAAFCISLLTMTNFFAVDCWLAVTFGVN